MTIIVPREPARFTEAALTGFAELYDDHVRPVDGGFVRCSGVAPGQVAVVVGGGSGHYPAFAGVVGDGLAAGAVCGNVFASPSAGQVDRVSREAEAGGGVLLAFGNYAGDVLNFGQAAERLRRDCIDTRVVTVTDDVASGPPDQPGLRRGVAGDLVVFKVAGAAAWRGDDLDTVEALALRANDRTRSLGVAFSGCTLPGADEPLFTVPSATMSVGLGIHGEAGISEEPLPCAEDLAALLVDRLLAERPAGADERVVPLLNGLGTVKYEELFGLYAEVAARLRAAGLTVLEPECGELVTSLDMSGLSLTLLWPDDELLELWRAPADAPAYSRGTTDLRRTAPRSPSPSTPSPSTPPIRLDRATSAVPAARRPGQEAECRQAYELLEAVRHLLAAHEEELGLIDAIAGDGDHGRGMARGSAGAAAAAGTSLDTGTSLGSLLHDAGEAWSDDGGGTSGALWGAAIQAAGRRLDRGTDETAVLEAVEAAHQAIVTLGNAAVGDKTMVDALAPFVSTLRTSLGGGATLAAAWAEAAQAADAAAQATASLRPRLGRARPLAERSLGHPDAGAVSLALVLRTLGEAATGAIPPAQKEISR